MRCIVLFKGGVETQEFFSVEMAKTFEKNGFEVIWFNLVFEHESTKELENKLAERKYEDVVAFTFNFSGIAGEEGLYDNRNFWDDYNVHVYNMVIDHPLYYQKYERFLPEKYTHISLDKNHIAYMKRFYPHIDLGVRDLNKGNSESDIRKNNNYSNSNYSNNNYNSNYYYSRLDNNRLINTGFLPLGGTEINSARDIIADRAYLDIKDRPLDVVFTGNYTPPESFDKFLQGMDKEYQDFYHKIVDEAIKSPDETIENVAWRCFKDELEGTEDSDISDEEFKLCMPNMMFVDLSVRFYYRAKVIKAIADSGIKVHTYGAGWELLECRHPENIIRAGGVDSQKCLDVISQAKISVNVMPWFKDGAHDRIFNSMLNGALCLSDKSLYLCEEFTDGENIAFYDLKDIEKVPKIINMYLSDTDKLEKTVKNAYEKCCKRHSWEERTDEICELIEYDLKYKDY